MAKKTTPQPPLSPEKYLKTRARTLPIEACWINPGWAESGMASIIVARKHKNGNFTFGIYLVDTFCLGVKDAFFRFNNSEDEYREVLENASPQPLISISYEEAHNLIYGALGYAEELGIKPCKDFALARFILEEDTEDIPLIEYTYGKNGKPFLCVQTYEEALKYFPLLDKNIGKKNYDIYIKEEIISDYDEEEDF